MRGGAAAAAAFFSNYLLLIECPLVKGRTRRKDKLNENVLEAQGQCLEAPVLQNSSPRGRIKGGYAWPLMQLFSGNIEPVTQAWREAPAPVFQWCLSVVRPLLPLRYSLMGFGGKMN